ncbi:hypothetical protein CG51_05325 [Haematobacter missouriensis]|uniref:DUF1376 domain-containing protein n=1 Tax=Haematobacter missouriensis TaxID=366616 RepID=A0A212AHT6_9RHOB|nr:hypothetical protein [Haematobacter missouriensis]KFI34263.1 hypothetical protein CG51_05325 [Haematobacter missouriensis]OWJ72406.1 hypothetical protein CDV53_17570 [Haematobacter missouriensis]OWJ81090.1 hypothetical protein CDV52_19615 [Haematobacter missouriensis]
MNDAPRTTFSVVDVDHLPEYPLSRDDRLTSHFFVTFYHRRWLNSRFRLSAPAMVRGLALDLFFIAQEQTPVGTLPDDDVQLSALLLLDLREWQALRRAEWSPLYKWQPCLCDGERRLMHPVVTEAVLDAIGRRRKREEEGEIGRRRKRLDRLPEQVRRAGGSARLANDMNVLEWVDSWLQHYCQGTRTRDWVKRALEAHSMQDAPQLTEK